MYYIFKLVDLPKANPSPTPTHTPQHNISCQYLGLRCQDEDGVVFQTPGGCKKKREAQKQDEAQKICESF